MTDVAIFLPSLEGGGAERAMVTLANQFALQGLAVDVVLARADGAYMAELAPSVRVVNLGAGRIIFSLLPLRRYFRTERPSSMLSALNHANLVAIAARLLAGGTTRLVVSERNNVSLGERTSKSIRARAILPLMRLLYRYADRVVAVSQGVADDLRNHVHLPAGMVEVIYNPVITDGLLRKAASQATHPWLTRRDVPVVLGVGRLTAQKDFAALIAAFSIVRAKRAAKLIILGEGELRHELESQIAALGLQSDVAMPGFDENPFPWMRACSVFVLSSRWEGLPNVLIQAMACGTPVVSTDCPSGPREILEGGTWGTLVQVANPGEMADAILASLDKPSRPPAHALSRFEATTTASQYLKALGQ